jgi:hypothetical protein
LIYANGGCKELPDGKERWEAAEAVLRVLQTSTKIAEVLRSTPDIARRLPREEACGAGAFDDLRLLPGPPLEAHFRSLQLLLATGVIEEPPYRMRWLADPCLRRTLLRMTTTPLELIIQFITEEQRSLTWFKESLDWLTAISPSELQISQLLALRGLIASTGIIKHCLCRRHRVDYGIDPQRHPDNIDPQRQKSLSRGSKVAVPFTGSDTPHQTAEWAHSDTQIVLTLLSYYHDGISRADVKEALLVLLSPTVGEAARTDEYNLWLDSARASMTQEELEALDDTTK